MEEQEKAPRGVKTMAIVRWGLVILSAVIALWSWSPYVLGQHGDHGASTAPKTKYQCPMHPQVVSDSPGECPICHMTLQPIQVQPTPAPSSSPSPSASQSAAPMPSISANPHAGHAMPASASAHAGHAMAMPSAAPASSIAPGTVPPGTTPITLTFDRLQSIGVRTSLAEDRDGAGVLRVTATVSAPEQGVAEVHVRTPGFVERISVRETGVRVGGGQEMLGIYSPEVFQAQTELLAAKAFGETGARAVEGARQKLELLGMSPAAIDSVIASGKPMRVISVSAPAGGYVSKKNVALGSYVTPETTLYEIVDLSRVYVVADVYARDVAAVRVGTEGRFLPQQGEPVSAKVDLIYPQMGAEARTTRVRMQVKNAKLALRPGQYGYVEFTRDARKVVVVPRDAVVDTGRVAYVFVDEGDGRFTPKVVAIGSEIGDSLEVLAGIAAGDRVVSGATFLIDSESRLQASLAQTSGAAPPSACDADFDRAKYPDKYADCQRCEKQHAGMGSMADDCKKAIAKPWR